MIESLKEKYPSHKEANHSASVHESSSTLRQNMCDRKLIHLANRNKNCCKLLWSRSTMIMYTMTTTAFLVFMVMVSIPSGTMALEFHRPYDHRSAMNTLKELDKYYSQLARPRFGKRNNNIAETNQDNVMPFDLIGSNNMAPADYLPVESAIGSSSAAAGGGGGSMMPGAILDNGPYGRWLMINRDQPMTKLTENYLLEILAENIEHRRQQQQMSQEKRQNGAQQQKKSQNM